MGQEATWKKKTFLANICDRPPQNSTDVGQYHFFVYELFRKIHVLALKWYIVELHTIFWSGVYKSRKIVEEAQNDNPVLENSQILLGREPQENAWFFYILDHWTNLKLCKYIIKRMNNIILWKSHFRQKMTIAYIFGHNSKSTLPTSVLMRGGRSHIA